MPRATTGGVIERRGKTGVTFALRFRFGGQRHQLSLGPVTRREAEEALRDVLAQIRLGQWSPPGADVPEVQEVPRFDEFAHAWLDARIREGGRGGKGLRDAGRKDFTWQIDNHLVPAFGHLRVDAITTQLIDGYRQGKLAEGRVGVTSINKTLAALASILSLAEEYDYISKVPKVRKLRAAKPSRTYLDNAGHIAALVEAAGALDREARRSPAYRRPLIATLVFAGPRIGEALEIRWSDVDLAAGTLRIRGTKTDAAVRRLKLLPVLRESLSEWKAAQRDPRPTDRVFATATGEAFSASNIRTRVLAVAVERASDALAAEGGERMPDGLTPHSLRRTFASVLVALGEPMTYTKRAMGHTTAAMTLSAYADAMEWEDGHGDRLAALVGGWEAATDAGSGAHRAHALAAAPVRLAA